MFLKNKVLLSSITLLLVFNLNYTALSSTISLTELIDMDESKHVYKVVISRYSEEPEIISEEDFLNDELYIFLNR